MAIGAVSASASTFSEVFSGHVGLDPYTTAVSDVYQDLFGEGSYVGKGIYDVDAFERALEGRVPDNALLSHDLFEGLFARVALCTDLEVIDDYPSHYLTWVARLHRWVRGDWQLLPWLWRTVPTQSGTRVRNVLPAIARWKMVDNLRRSLLPLALVILLAAGWLVLPAGRRCGRARRFWCCSFPRTCSGDRRSPTACAASRLRDHLRAERDNLASSLHQVLLHSAFLAHQSIVMLDAIGRTLVRLVTRQHLLEWETAADAAARLQGEWPLVLRRMWMAPVAGRCLWPSPCSRCRPSSALWALPVVVAVGDLALLRLSTPACRNRVTGTVLDARERRELRRTARLTWRFFEEIVSRRRQLARARQLSGEQARSDRASHVAHQHRPADDGGGLGLGSRLHLRRRNA